MSNMRAGGVLTLLVLVGLLAASLAVAQKDDQAEVLMQAANHKQLVEGELEEAIQIYKRIAQEYAGNRALAAKALVQMGQCYEKLGKEEARNAYERVLREYADQSEAADAARRRLAALGRPAASGNNSAMVVRRIWAGPGWWLGGSPSPDGRHLSYIDWTRGDLALRDLVTGTVRHLTKAESGEYAFDSAISPDGKQVAYTWFGKDGPDLRLVRLDGSTPRILFSSKEAITLPSDWSRDGKYLLSIVMKLVNQVQWTPQIALISVADGSVRVLKTFGWGFPRKTWFSTDGRYIAYDFPPRQDSGNRDIFLLAADGSREIPLVEHPADDMLLGWTPDGNHILFASDRSGSMGAWMIRVVDGKPQGSPELVKRDIGAAQPLGFTRAGSYYYGVVMGTSDVYTAEFDPAAGRVLTQPQNATQRFVGSNSSPAWSPDGQFLAYGSNREKSWIGADPGVISIRSLKTGEERDLSPNLFEIWGPMRWSPDGRVLLVGGKDRKLQQGLYLIDAQTGEVTPLLRREPDSGISAPAWFPDGKRLLYGERRREAGATIDTILIRDFDTDRGTELFRAAPGVKIDDIALSPDGQQVALTLLEMETRSSALKVLLVAGGEASELVRAKEPETISGDSLSWSADSRYILFGKGRATGQERKTELLAISSRGGEPHALGLDMDSVHAVSFHPDGRRLAFAVSGGNKMEIWVMENFLPQLKPARSRQEER